jgi:hypothetical protein
MSTKDSNVFSPIQIASNTFNHSYTIIDCSSATSVEDIYNDVLSLDARVNHRPSRPCLNTESVCHELKSLIVCHVLMKHSGQSSKRSSYRGCGDYSKPPATPSQLTNNNVVNIVIAKNFNFVSDDIQMHMLQVGIQVIICLNNIDN